jgi:hypothetical protein
VILFLVHQIHPGTMILLQVEFFYLRLKVIFLILVFIPLTVVVFGILLHRTKGRKAGTMIRVKTKIWMLLKSLVISLLILLGILFLIRTIFSLMVI